jgi:hypothetical protein
MNCLFTREEMVALLRKRQNAAGGATISDPDEL